MLETLTTESSNPASKDLDLLSTKDLVQLLNDEDAKVAAAVKKESTSIALAIDQIVKCLARHGRLIYVGAGTSGRIGVLDAVECPPTFNTHPDQIIGLMAGGYEGLVKAVEGAEDATEAGATDLQKLSLTGSDCVVGISASGRTPYVLGALAYARGIEATTIGFCCNVPNEMASVADIIIAPIVGPEIISGSTRLKAGTATKMVLNMLSTAAMVQLGKTYGNYMVDVQATNTKLQDRAIRMLTALTGLSYPSATALLDKCEGELKTAILAHSLQIEVEAAREKLGLTNGHLRKALLL